MIQLQSTAELRRPTGLDTGARESLLRPFIEAGLNHRQVMLALFKSGAYGGLDDYLAALREGHGAEAAERVRFEMRSIIDRRTDQRRLDFEQARREAADRYGALGFLLAIPDADFLVAVEAAIGIVGDAMRTTQLPYEINHVCEKRGIQFRLRGVGRLVHFEWIGDETLAEDVVGPALSAIDDPRFAGGVRTEFNEARKELREDTPESRKQAVAESCSAVESALKVLLDEHGKARPAPATLSRLVREAVRQGLVAAEMEGVLVAPSRFGNERARHGAGPEAHDVSGNEAQAVVAAAASAITYLAQQLPGNS